MTTPSSTLIGIVGFTPVLEPFPLGPKLMERLQMQVKGIAALRIENMSWSPIHIVQQLEEAGDPPGRVILVGAAAVSRSPGRVRAYRWVGGKQSDAELQARIYEAVTGIVDVENTLAVGAHFGVWPEECFTVECDLPADSFGLMVIAADQGRTGDRELEAELGFSPAAMIQTVSDMALALARSGAGAGLPLHEKSSNALAKTQSFLHTVPVRADSGPRRESADDQSDHRQQGG